MTCSARIVNYDGSELTVIPMSPINRELMKKQVEDIEIRLIDGRSITNEQRRKIFAICTDIGKETGHSTEEVRKTLRNDFCDLYDIDRFSLSTVDMTTAREFISFLIDFCMNWDIPTKDVLLHYCDDIEQYLYMCLANRKCAICNAHAEVHHVDRVGMGFDREQIVHEGLRAIALCRRHHAIAHLREKALFEKNHVFGIPLDKNLCEILNLKASKDGSCDEELQLDISDQDAVL